MTLKSKIEAVLFVTRKALSAKEIAEIVEDTAERVEDALLELIMDYASRDGALEIDDEDGYILQTREEHMDIVEKLVPAELSQATLKTLAVIALKEPVRQSYVKELRGQNAYEHIERLVQKGFVVRKRDKNGKSFNVKTTSKFREYFKLKGDVKSLSKLIEEDENLKD